MATHSQWPDEGRDNSRASPGNVTVRLRRCVRRRSTQHLQVERAPGQSQAAAGLMSSHEPSRRVPPRVLCRAAHQGRSQPLSGHLTPLQWPAQSLLLWLSSPQGVHARADHGSRLHQAGPPVLLQLQPQLFGAHTPLQAHLVQLPAWTAG